MTKRWLKSAKWKWTIREEDFLKVDNFLAYSVPYSK